MNLSQGDGSYSAASAAWERDRRELSHQVVKNSLLSHAERLARAQSLQSDAVTREEITWLRSSWGGFSPRLREVVDRCETSCSPRQILASLLDENAVSKELRCDLAAELHEEWCETLHVRTWAHSTQRLIEKFDALLAEEIPDGAALERTCRSLSDILHDHPTRNGPI